MYDGLSKHAVAYRQLSFALKNRWAWSFSKWCILFTCQNVRKILCIKHCFGTRCIACLPIIETLGNDLSAYIATNVVSITDGEGSEIVFYSDMAF